MRRSELLLCFGLMVAACAHPPVGETLSTADGERTYLLHLPAHAPAGRYPLVIVMHGGGGTAAGFRAETRFDELADREGFAVVYPQGLRKHWNDGRVENGAAPVDDVAYISSLIDHLIATHPIDPARVFATGISNGGFMSYRLACDLADKIAAVAPVAGQVSTVLAPRCAPSHPVSLLAINGTADPIVPWRGGVVLGNRGAMLGTVDSVGVIARANQCSPDGTATWEPDHDPADVTSVQHVVYSGCTGGVAVELLNINRGGHTWPGGRQYLPVALVGVVSRELWASERIWQFFAQHGRAAPVTSPGG